MISRALDDRLPPTERGLEYATWNTLRDEDWVEDDKGELGAVIRRPARRATPNTRPRGDVPVTARRAKSSESLTDVTDSESSETDGSDVEESTMSSHKTSKPKGEAGKSNSGWKDEVFASSDSEERGDRKIAPKPEDDEDDDFSSLQNLKMMSPAAVEDRFPAQYDREL